MKADLIQLQLKSLQIIARVRGEEGDRTVRDDIRGAIKTIKALVAELEYLKWFRINADFGPADSDVIAEMDARFEKETGKKVPKNWRTE